MGRRMTAREMMIAEEEYGQQGHEEQVRSNRNMGERRGDCKGDSDTGSEG